LGFKWTRTQALSEFYSEEDWLGSKGTKKLDLRQRRCQSERSDFAHAAGQVGGLRC
jgi:hypothetical protein